jgi:predicted HTH transcriptional regulator
MIDKPLEQITYADLDRFVQEKWPEGKTVDYKRDLYGGKDEDKKELLKDASSFANTEGGDILIGVDEDKGLPIGIPGVTVADVDKEKLRLEEIIRRGLDPRIEFAIHHVTTPGST